MNSTTAANAPTQTASTAGGRSLLICSLILAAGVFLLYRTALRADFVWDDEFLILDNPAIQSLAKIPDFFSYHLAYASQNRNIYYRPLQETSYALDYSLWKLDPSGYHLTNLLLHALNAWMLLIVLRRLTGRLGPSFAAAAFFAAQPMQSQAVAYVAGRADLLSAFFLLVALWAYVSAERARSRRMALGAAAYLLALFSREVALALPFLLFFHDLAFAGKPRWDKMAVYAAPIVIFLGLRHWALAKTLPITETRFHAPPFELRFPLSFKLLTHYVTNLVWPRGLHMEQQIRAASGWLDPWVLGGFACYGFAGWTWLRRRVDPVPAFLSVWFLVFWFPVANLVPLHKALADHWMYLPSMGFYGILALGASRALPGSAAVRTALAALAAAPILTYFCLYTIERNTAWANSKALYQDILRYDPGNTRVQLNLGNAYLRDGDFDTAAATYRKLIRGRPEASPEAYSNLGYIHYLRGQLETAEENLLKAVAQDPLAAIARTNLALVYQKMGRLDRSGAELEKALGISPSYFQAQLAMGVLQMRLGNAEKAVPYLEAAVRLSPDNPKARRLLELARGGQVPSEKDLVSDPASKPEQAPDDGDAAGKATYVIVKRFDEWGEVIEVEEK